MFFFLYRDTGISRLGSRWVLGYPGGLSRCPSGVPGYRDIPVPGYPGTGISRCPSGGHWIPGYRDIPVPLWGVGYTSTPTNRNRHCRITLAPLPACGGHYRLGARFARASRDGDYRLGARFARASRDGHYRLGARFAHASSDGHYRLGARCAHASRDAYYHPPLFPIPPFPYIK